jgi:hypothetical protein
MIPCKVVKTKFESEFAFRPHRKVLENEPNTHLAFIILQAESGSRKTADKVSGKLSPRRCLHRKIFGMRRRVHVMTGGWCRGSILLRRMRRGVRRVVWGSVMCAVGWISRAVRRILWGVRVIRNGRLGWRRDLKCSLRGGVRVHHQIDLFLAGFVP